MIGKQGATLGFLTTTLVDYALRMRCVLMFFFFFLMLIHENAVVCPPSFLDGSRPCVCIISVVLAFLIPIA